MEIPAEDKRTAPAENSRRVMILFLVVAIEIVLAMYLLLPEGVDWALTFRPAARALASGQSPYSSEIVRSPYAGAPWGLIPLIPFAVLPEKFGRTLLFVTSILSFAYAAIRLGARPPALTAFLLSPPVMHSLLNANIDWMPLLGFILPPQIGLFFLAVKPQMGIALALFWLIEAWREGGLARTLRVFGPFTAALLASLLLFGLWPANAFTVQQESLGWNASLWPASIPVGLALLAASIRLRKSKYAMAASPCLSPYVLLHSWSAALVALAGLNAEMIAAVAGLWLLILLRAIFPGM